MTKEKFCRESRVIQTHRVFPFDLNPFGALFGGKLMSLIDDAASISVSRHCRRGAVTTSLDNLNFLKPLKENHSVCVETFVSGVHHKSMEVFVKVVGEDLTTGERYLAATCFTTFVAIPSHMNPKSDFQLAAVVPETAEEKLICSNYETRRQQRLALREETKLFSQHLTTDLPWIDSPL